MIGGRVIETLVVQGDNTRPTRVWINRREENYTEGYLFGEPCAIYVEDSPQARCVGPGDIVWWQSGRAYWTPFSRGRRVGPVEVPLKRVGYSGVKRPEEALVES